MADKYYGLKIGQQTPSQVVEGAASGGVNAPIELRVNDTVYASKYRVILALETLLNYMQSSKETSPIA
jgi:hypothetical protein